MNLILSYRVFQQHRILIMNLLVFTICVYIIFEFLFEYSLKSTTTKLQYRT